MTELATAGVGGGGTLGSLRAATVRYDYRNQMVEYAADDGFGPHAYLYDALGRRVAKRVADAGTGQIVGTRFISAGNTRSAATWQTIEEYYEGPQMLTASYIHGIYIDEVLSMRRADGSGVVRDYYYHQDDLFNATLLTDSSGAAVERYEYGDYGAPRFFDGGGAALDSSALGNARLFNGREWDAEVAMYYYRTRYLEPTLGRFTARDTIGVWGDAGNVGNGVAYVAAAPYSYIDPFGQRPDTMHDYHQYEYNRTHPPRPPNTRHYTFPDDEPHSPIPNEKDVETLEDVVKDLRDNPPSEKLDRITLSGHGGCPGGNGVFTAIPWLSKQQLDEIRKYRESPDSVDKTRRKLVQEHDKQPRDIERSARCIEIEACRVGRDDELFKKLKQLYPESEWEGWRYTVTREFGPPIAIPGTNKDK